MWYINQKKSNKHIIYQDKVMNIIKSPVCYGNHIKKCVIVGNEIYVYGWNNSIYTLNNK